MTKKKPVAMYVRVSTNDQSTKSQEVELKRYAENRGWTETKIYKDQGFSGAKTSRPALDELMADCRRRKVGVVLVWKFDRFARSLRQLINALDEFKRLKIDFISVTEGVDTTIPSGELVFNIMGAIAQFERALISERVKAGMEQARREGKRIGRPQLRHFSGEETQRIRNQYGNKKTSIRQLAMQFGTTQWMVNQILAGRNATL